MGIHPVAAAIQSVYVCRRDLEKDDTIGLGRIILPSMLFHGTYDLVLLMVTSSWQRTHKDIYFYNAGGVNTVAVMCFSASLFFVLAGWAYFMRISLAQYKRLGGAEPARSGST